VSIGLLIAFALAVLPLSVTPGVSSTLVATRVLTGGRAEGVKVACGTATGLYVHATAAAAGLAAVIMASSLAFTVVKVVGAVYLVWLGVVTWRNASRGTISDLPWIGHGSYVQALLGNVLNPKASAVYLTLLPQFIDPTASVIPQIYVLATVHVAVALVYLTLLSQLVAAAGTALSRPRVRALIQRVTGVVLVGLGLRAAAATRA
jgi:threonine/homoserine/homoserine lactone efflux protein